MRSVFRKRACVLASWEISSATAIVNTLTGSLAPYFPHISNGISGEFPGRVLSLSGASAPVVNLHVHISFSLAFPDKP